MRMLKTMLVCFVSLMMLVGCSKKDLDKEIIDPTVEPTEETEITPTPEISDLSFGYRGKVSDEMSDEIEEQFGISVSSIFVDSQCTKIGCIFKGGGQGCISEEDPTQGFWFDNEGQEFKFNGENEYASLYYSELKKIDEGIYSSHGAFCPYDEKVNQGKEIVEDIDYYVVIQDNKLSIVFSEEEAFKDELTSYYMMYD